MPAESKAQQGAVALALSAKRGKVDPKTLRGAAKQMYNSMTEKQLAEYATKPQGEKPLPKFARGRPHRLRKAASA